MKVYECSPFFNENLICAIKAQENRFWVDELHIAEADRTFTCLPKEYSLQNPDPDRIRHHRIDGERNFRRPGYGLTVKPWFFKYKIYSWYNEYVQRNLASAFIEPEDSDIVILSDIDEIIDHKFADKIIELVKKYRIITVKLHFTCYYFNLYLKNRGGPGEFSYRVFVMTGEKFRTLSRCVNYVNFRFYPFLAKRLPMQMTPDQLRKSGEMSRLLQDIYCMDEIAGFHHSWLGDIEQIARKMVSYAHAPEDHNPRAFTDGKVNADFILDCVRNRQSIYGSGPSLFTDESIPLLDSVIKLKSELPELFLAV